MNAASSGRVLSLNDNIVILLKISNYLQDIALILLVVRKKYHVHKFTGSLTLQTGIRQRQWYYCSRNIINKYLRNWYLVNHHDVSDVPFLAFEELPSS